MHQLFIRNLVSTSDIRSYSNKNCEWHSWLTQLTVDTDIDSWMIQRFSIYLTGSDFILFCHSSLDTFLFQDVFFPSIIVCNINQIRKSLLRGLGLKNYDDIDLLYRQFYTGSDRNLTEKEMETIRSLATSEVVFWY